MEQDRVKKIGIFYKDDPNLIEIAKEVRDYLLRKNIEVVMDDDLFKTELGKDSIILSLGGDGTFLGASRIAIMNDAGVLGINLGNLGFLTDVEGMDIYVAVDKLLKGEYFIEERNTLVAEVNGIEDQCFHAVNDFIIQKDIFDKILQIEVSVDGNKAGKFRCDGVIISTSTGSTAYALSVGGPIIFPQAEVFELSFIAPHKLSSRPLILSNNNCLELEIESDGNFHFIRDGIEVLKLKKFDRIEFKLNEKRLKIVHIKGKNFFEILNKKFNWGT